MKLIEQLIPRFSNRASALAFHPITGCSSLPVEVVECANRGWLLFPVARQSKVTHPNLLIKTATSEVSQLEQMAAVHQPVEWRVAIGPSVLCALQLTGPESRYALAAISPDEWECLTLQARRGEAVQWAYFRWPTGLRLRANARHLAPGVRILADGDSCPVPPLGGCAFTNPWAEVEAVPQWLLQAAFEGPQPPPGHAAPARTQPPTRCRTYTQSHKPKQQVRKGNPIHGHGICRGGRSIPCRR